MNFLKLVKLQDVHEICIIIIIHIVNMEFLYPLWNNVLQLTVSAWQKTTTDCLSSLN